jgi:hypothetical protein
MSPERSVKSHAMAWIVTVLVAVPVLYVLTFPVVMWYAYWKDRLATIAPENPSGSSPIPFPMSSSSEHRWPRLC